MENDLKPIMNELKLKMACWKMWWRQNSGWRASVIAELAVLCFALAFLVGSGLSAFLLMLLIGSGILLLIAAFVNAL
jgi:hypothetical protein